MVGYIEDPLHFVPAEDPGGEGRFPLWRQVLGRDVRWRASPIKEHNRKAEGVLNALTPQDWQRLDRWLLVALSQSEAQEPGMAWGIFSVAADKGSQEHFADST